MTYNPYTKYINFLKKHNLYNEKILMYIGEYATFFNYFEGQYFPISTFPIKDVEKRIIGIRTIIPNIDDDITTILNIQEYIKLSLYYNKIGKIIEEEPNSQLILALQLLFTKLFISENQTEELLKLEKTINEESNEENTEAMKLADNLQAFYCAGITNLESLVTEAERLTKKNPKKKKRRNDKRKPKID